MHHADSLERLHMPRTPDPPSRAGPLSGPPPAQYPSFLVGSQFHTSPAAAMYPRQFEALDDTRPLLTSFRVSTPSVRTLNTRMIQDPVSFTQSIVFKSRGMSIAP